MGKFVSFQMGGSVEVSSANYTGGIDIPYLEPSIGASMDEEIAGPIYFDGNIDEIKVYNYALNSDSILAHYNMLKP